MLVFERLSNILALAYHKEIHFSDFLAAMIDGTHVQLHDKLLHEAGALRDFLIFLGFVYGFSRFY